MIQSRTSNGVAIFMHWLGYSLNISWVSSQTSSQRVACWLTGIDPSRTDIIAVSCYEFWILSPCVAMKGVASVDMESNCSTSLSANGRQMAAHHSGHRSTTFTSPPFVSQPISTTHDRLSAAGCYSPTSWITAGLSNKKTNSDTGDLCATHASAGCHSMALPSNRIYSTHYVRILSMH